MKKYKLIKIYPGSPKLNSIAVWGDHGLTGNCYQAKCDDIHRFSEETIENNPEYWEKVIDKEFEIISYINHITGEVNFIGQRFLSNEGYREFKESDLNRTNSTTKKKIYNIYAVLRYDNEVFTIGDLVAKHKSWEDGIPCYITEFNLVKNKLTFKVKQGKNSDNYLFDKKVYKYKSRFLFKTEDGVNIFKDDIYHVVNSHTLKYCSTQSHGCNSEPPYKVFSTKEAAEEYINSRKPYLSNKDVLDEIEKCTSIQQLKKVFTNKAAY